MIASVVLGFLVTILVLIWPIPFTIDSSWFSRWIGHRRLDEDASLLQLAEAFARRIERERAQIAEKINDPETISEVSRLLICFCADLNPQNSAAENRKYPFTRPPRLFGDAQSYPARASSSARNIDANLRPRRVGKENPGGVARLPPVERRRAQDARALVYFRTGRLYLHDAGGFAAFRRSALGYILARQLRRDLATGTSFGVSLRASAHVRRRRIGPVHGRGQGYILPLPQPRICTE